MDKSQEQLYQEHLSALHDVAANYWQQQKDLVREDLASIRILKHTGGKIMGVLPQYRDFKPVFAKVYFYDRGFQFESEGLSAANRLGPVNDVSTPTLVRIIQEKRAILTEKEDWHDTSTPIKRFFVNSLGIDWFRVGSWLRRFHDSKTSYEKNEYFLHKKFEKLNAHLDTLRNMFTPIELEKINSVLCSAKDFFETQTCEWVISHGDFGLDNIKKANESLYVIDFEDCQMAPREFDILNCLVRLDYVDGFPHRRGVYKDVIQQFESGYGREISHSKVFNMFYLFIKLDLLETYQRRRNIQNCLTPQLIIYSLFSMANHKKLTFWLSEMK